MGILSAVDAESSIWWLQQQIIFYYLGDFTLYGMQVQKKRSKDSSKQVDLTAADAVRQQLQSVGITRFQGYEDVQGAGAVVAILKDGNMIETAREGRRSRKDHVAEAFASCLCSPMLAMRLPKVIQDHWVVQSLGQDHLLSCFVSNFFVSSQGSHCCMCLLVVAIAV